MPRSVGAPQILPASLFFATLEELVSILARAARAADRPGRLCWTRGRSISANEAVAGLELSGRPRDHHGQQVGPEIEAAADKPAPPGPSAPLEHQRRGATRSTLQSRAPRSDGRHARTGIDHIVVAPKNRGHPDSVGIERCRSAMRRCPTVFDDRTEAHPSAAPDSFGGPPATAAPQEVPSHQSRWRCRGVTRSIDQRCTEL